PLRVSVRVAGVRAGLPPGWDSSRVSVFTAEAGSSEASGGLPPLERSETSFVSKPYQKGAPSITKSAVMNQPAMVPMAPAPESQCFHPTGKPSSLKLPTLLPISFRSLGGDGACPLEVTSCARSATALATG